MSKLGNIIIRVSRVVEVITHSEGKEARKLEALNIPGREFRGSLSGVDRILRDFYVSRGVGYNLIFLI